MFGGNPGGKGKLLSDWLKFLILTSDWSKENRLGKLRLGDFWRLELLRQQNTDLERVLVKVTTILCSDWSMTNCVLIGQGDQEDSVP